MNVDYLLVEQVQADCRYVDNVDDILKIKEESARHTVVTLQGIIVFSSIEHLDDSLTIKIFRPGLWVEKLHTAAKTIRDRQKEKQQLNYTPIDDKEIWND